TPLRGVGVLHLGPRRREVEARVDLLRTPRDERLQHNADDTERTNHVEQNLLRCFLVGFHELPGCFELDVAVHGVEEIPQDRDDGHRVVALFDELMNGANPLREIMRQLLSVLVVEFGYGVSSWNDEVKS